MKFTERKEWLYDSEVFKQQPDVTTALGIQAEYIKRGSPRPPPTFMEVDRSSDKFDALWHVSLDDRTVFSRVFQMPVLIQFEKPDWRLTRVGIVPQQKHTVWMANTILKEQDWFPMRGDMMFYNGYRHIIVDVELKPEAYWMQTNVWLGLTCRTVIPAQGDARPLTNVAEAVPRELIQTRPVPYA